MQEPYIPKRLHCLKHIPEKYARQYAKRFGSHTNNNYFWAESHYKILLTRIYIRSKAGKRGFIPFGWFCPKCDKVYSDDYVLNSFKKFKHRFFTN